MSPHLGIYKTYTLPTPLQRPRGAARRRIVLACSTKREKRTMPGLICHCLGKRKSAAGAGPHDFGIKCGNAMRPPWRDLINVYRSRRCAGNRRGQTPRNLPNAYSSVAMFCYSYNNVGFVNGGHTCCGPFARTFPVNKGLWLDCEILAKRLLQS
jgi:hypothetical protein